MILLQRADEKSEILLSRVKMPVVAKKPLYLAKNLGELNKRADIPSNVGAQQ